MYVLPPVCLHHEQHVQRTSDGFTLLLYRRFLMQVNMTVSLSCLLACIETCACHGGESKSPAQTTEPFHGSNIGCLQS